VGVATVLAGTHFLAYIQGRIDAYQHTIEIERKRESKHREEPTK
jgi:hypothetical protein